MAFFDSKSSKFFITDTGSTERELTAYITEISGLPGTRALDEVTSLADSGRKFIPGLEDVSISLSGMFDNTATTGPDAVIGPLRTHTSATAFNYGPEGNASGDTKYSGNCWVESYEVSSSVGNRVQWSATLKVDGTVTRETYTP